MPLIPLIPSIPIEVRHSKRKTQKYWDVSCLCAMTVILSCLLETRKEQCHQCTCGRGQQSARLVGGWAG